MKVVTLTLSVFVAMSPMLCLAANDPVPAEQVKTLDTTSSLDDKNTINYGDLLNYRVVEDRDETKKIPVNESGEINLPYYGPVKAAGKTCFKLAQEVKILLEKNLYNKATVVISFEETRKGRVFVVGAVGRPGPVEITTIEKLTVSKAILAAGGFTQFGNKGKVKIIRKTGEGPKDRKELVVDVGAVLEKGQLDKDVEVMGGDMVIVSEKLINF